jgi:hypothetical protein
MQILIKMMLVSLFSLGLVACEREGPMERAGESIDEAVEETGDAIDDATSR